MKMWLLKTEPTNYSFADLERDGETMWDGVSNNQALQNIRRIESGDLALVYHTGQEKAVVGTADVTRGFYVNPELSDEKLAVCDVKFKARLKNPVTLAQVKAIPELADWALVRNSRLSVVPVSEAQWQTLQKLAES
ncbi:putative RNA-binding protein, contains PUA-like domain [Abditibacterium utsteinense]|uniref:Putative RNA-binding protein, contains PUA-like domain n=1 Tax=Abditibacterium utsteinense TaxID=1960156 RepID=A0A2S8SQ12_9BACT|nr:EVE domain-containing protein [Abditibacterium utsteinense]PQV62887.1 putative RNA-binding protein, contains PUA-like domain [Abditibacterium utsteinense]